MRVLCVAEKPSVARSITEILSGGQFTNRPSDHKFIKNYDFNYPQTKAQFTVTSVLGHLTTHAFGEAYQIWLSCDPFALFDAPVYSQIPADNKSIERNLINEAKRSNMLMIWTDCDREGEHIGSEVARVCRKAKRDIIVKRARFSAIIAQQIHHAAQHPVELDRAQADAVEARSILDLRLGAAFTRMQTLSLRPRFDQLKESGPVSYGPCQFPTLGFVVSRYNQVKAFVPEPFWYIALSLSRPTSSKENTETNFIWRRGHLFGMDVAIVLYEHVLSDPVARVVKVTKKTTKKWKPLPLTTVELQKAASRLLRLAPKKVLDIAEKLYQRGFLSYPRTETDQFDPQFDFMSLIAKQTVDLAWGPFATSLEQGAFTAPRKGKNNDKAHPPIHPTAHVGNLIGDEKKVYEFITRRFLACCSKDAEGWETTVDVVCGGEEFYATGLVVLERNYLVVYVYDKWNGKEIPEFEEGEEFQPSVCELREGVTSRPNLLTEADLVTLMDKNGIGTDATIAQHIQTIIDRDYVLERMEGATKYLVPSTLGIGLVEGYNKIGFDKSLSKPQLRRETERSMVQVCEGTKSKNDMLVQSIDQYKEIFIKAKRDFNKIVTSVHKHLDGNGEQVGPVGGNGGDDGDGDDRGGRGSGRGGRGRGRGRGRGTRGGGVQRGRGGRGGHRDAPPPPSGSGNGDDNGHQPLPTTTLAPVPYNRAHQVGLNSTSNSSIVVKCRCNVPAAERTVTKESASKGKRFWTCGDSRTCDFFEWIDAPSLALASGRSMETLPVSKIIPAKRTYPQCSGAGSSAQDDGATRYCQCSLTAIRLTAVKEGPNQGRPFWTCPNGIKAKCKFFEWDDEAGGSSNGAAASGSRPIVANQPTDECYKCHQKGHWASECPSGGSNNGLNQPRRFGSNARDNISPDCCFKCGKKGHFSNACPEGGSSSRPAAADGGAPLDECFKCHQTGHWSSACPNGEGTPLRSSANSAGEKRGRGGRSTSGSTKGRGGKAKRGKKKSAFGAADGV